MGGGVPLHILHLLARLSRVDPSGLEGAPPQVTVVMGDNTTQDAVTDGDMGYVLGAVRALELIED